MKLTCHCKNIQIEVQVPNDLNCCNCSICSRYQALWGYYEPSSVQIEMGSVGENVYTWNDREIEFVRCAGCGCVTHYRTLPGGRDPKIGVNFRMAPEEALAKIPVRYSNGRAF